MGTLLLMGAGGVPPPAAGGYSIDVVQQLPTGVGDDPGFGDEFMQTQIAGTPPNGTLIVMFGFFKANDINNVLASPPYSDDIGDSGGERTEWSAGEVFNFAYDNGTGYWVGGLWWRVVGESAGANKFVTLTEANNINPGGQIHVGVYSKTGGTWGLSGTATEGQGNGTTAATSPTSITVDSGDIVIAAVIGMDTNALTLTEYGDDPAPTQVYTGMNSDKTTVTPQATNGTDRDWWIGIAGWKPS